MRAVLFALALLSHGAIGAPSNGQEEHSRKREVCDIQIHHTSYWKGKTTGQNTLFIWHIETRKRGKNSEKTPAITAIYCCDIRIVTFKDYIMACDYD